jgi:bifunctional non-homologous end joining protein LigD
LLYSDPKAVDPITPIARKEPFDGPAWLFELKYDGFRGIADTIRGRMLSKNTNRMRRFESCFAGSARLRFRRGDRVPR